MLNSIFTSPVTFEQLLICMGSALVAGVLMALIFMVKSRSSASFAFTLAVLPLAMSMIVFIINGNLGVAVAVAGSFALVRFRSIAGTGKEISGIFLDMTIGVILGMGYVGVAAIFFVVTAVIVLLLTAVDFGSQKHVKILKITIPEDYDYEGLFDDVFAKYGVQASVMKLKTTNMGSLITVFYRITMKTSSVSKEMLDDLRIKNGNLSIMVTNSEYAKETL